MSFSEEFAISNLHFLTSYGTPEKFREIYNFAFGWAKEKVLYLAVFSSSHKPPTSKVILLALIYWQLLIFILSNEFILYAVTITKNCSCLYFLGAGYFFGTSY